MNQRALRQHAAAVRQRKHYQQTRQAHLDFLTAAVMLYHECRGLGLGIQLSQPEHREFRKRLVDAEDCEEKYLALRRPRIVKVADLPQSPAPAAESWFHTISADVDDAGEMHLTIDGQPEPYHGPERPQDWLPPCERCHKSFAGGYRSRTGTVNYCNNCLNTFDSEGA